MMMIMIMVWTEKIPKRTGLEKVYVHKYIYIHEHFYNFQVENVPKLNTPHTMKTEIESKHNYNQYKINP